MTPSRTLWITVLFIATFGVGLAAGFLLRPVLDPEPMGMQRSREGRDARFRDHVKAQLNLTPEQEVRFFDAMDAHRRKTRSMMEGARDSMHAKVRSETDSLRAEMAQFLTEEQLTQWERMMRRAMRGERGGPPD
jgi:Spy/CpxP family protein refolding chaperone